MKQAGISIGTAGFIVMIVAASSADNLALVELLYGMIIGSVMLIGGNGVYVFADYLGKRRRRHCKRAKRSGRAA